MWIVSDAANIQYLKITEYKCLACNKNYRKMFDKNLKRRIVITCKFSTSNMNKFIVLLLKGVYSYEYMDDWGKLKETSLPKQNDFYSHLNMEMLLMQITRM